MQLTNTSPTSDYPKQNYSHSLALDRSTIAAGAEFCGFQRLRQSHTHLARSGSNTSSTQFCQLTGYSDSNEDLDEGTAPPLADVNLSKGEGCKQNSVYHDSPAPARETSISLSRQGSPPTCLPSEDISQVSENSSTPNFRTSKDIPQSTGTADLPHHREKRPDDTAMSSSRTTSVARSPSRSTLADRTPHNNRKRLLSPTTPLPPKRVNATGPFADSDDSDDDAPKVAAPPKRPILNLQRLKQAIAKNNQDTSNAHSQAAVGKEELARLEHGASSQVSKKNGPKDQQLGTAVAGLRKTVIASPNNVAKGGITGKQEAVLRNAQHAPRPVVAAGVPQSKPPNYQAGMKKVYSAHGAPRVDVEIGSKAGNVSGASKKSAGTAPVADSQTAAQKSAIKPASVSLTQDRKTPLQTEAVKKIGTNIQVAGQPKPAQRPVTGPPVATAKQQNSLQKHDAKRPASPAIPVPVKKQNTGRVPANSLVTTPGTSSVNTPTIPKKIPTWAEKTLITPKKNPAALEKAPSPSSPTPSVTSKTQPAAPKASPLVCSVTPTLLKQSPVALTSNSSGQNPATTTLSSSTSKATPIPSKVNPAQKPAQTTLKIPLETQNSFQITPKGNVNTPQEGFVAPKNVLASVSTAKAVLPSLKQSTIAQAASLPPKAASATPQVTPNTTKVAEPAKPTQVPKPTPVAPKAASVTLKAASIIQPGSSSPKTKEATASKSASLAHHATSVGQNTAQVIPKWSPQKGSPFQAVVNNVTPITTKVSPKPKDVVLEPSKAISNPAKETHLIEKEVPMVHKEAAIALQGSSTPSEISPVVQEVNLALPRSANEPASSATPTSETCKKPPFFEYTVFQKTFPASEKDSSTPSVQIATFTDIDNANAQAEKLHLAAAHQHPLVYDIQYSSWNNKPDAFDCMTYLGTFAPVEYPARKSYAKIWVERHPASAHTNRHASTKTYFLAKTVFILRLCKLVEPDSDDEAMEDSDSEDEEPMRVFQALPEGYAELYTTLDAANRAARRVQIEMSHEKEPKYGSKRMWQEKEANDLYDKVVDLEKNMGYWKSQFNEVRLGGDKFQLVVEQTRLFGPRNL
jgi:hypothetical protein